MALQGYITHTIQTGDSVQRLAVMYKIDNWRDIVLLNKLEYPFIDDEIGSTAFSDNPNVVKVGDSILIPSTYITPVAAEAVVSDLEKAAYGCDLDIFSFDEFHEYAINLEEKGELSATSGGDVRMAEGIRNLRQRMIIRLSVPKGAFILHPDFGSKLQELIGLKGTTQNLIKMRLEAQRCILTDPLIKGVSDLTVSKTAKGTALIDCKVVPVPPYQPFRFTETIVPE